MSGLLIKGLVRLAFLISGATGVLTFVDCWIFLAHAWGWMFATLVGWPLCALAGVFVAIAVAYITSCIVAMTALFIRKPPTLTGMR